MAQGEKQKITETLEKNYMPYAMSVIISRAIPEIDGFKPAHRKLLYMMYKMGLLHGNLTKSANIVGQTMKLNPHGDGPIYETMVRLTEGYEALNTPFVHSKGNFGKQYSRDMAYAASRYTEAKLASICNELFGEIDEQTVDFVDNYDGTMKEPLLLPVTFPNILVNPNQGIAVGMANNICGFNLVEVCEATIALLKNQEADPHQYMKAPDFPSGGTIIYKEKEMKEIFNSGRGTFKLRAKYRYDKKQNCIEIYEIPYNTTIELIVEKIVDLVKSNKIKEISDVRDETDLSGLKIAIDVKRNTDVDLLMHKLYAMAPLESSFSCNFNILVHDIPKVMGVKEILQEWIEFRMTCIKRKFTFNIDKMESKLHLLLGLNKLLLDIDKAIRIIRETEKEKLVIPNLMQGFDITEAQAEFIAEIKLRNLNQEYILKRVSEIETLEKEINKLKDVLQDDKKIKRVIVTQLTQIIKKYGTARKTEIILDEEIKEVAEEDMIEDYNVKIFITEHQYIKKISLASLRAASEQKVKEDDFIKQELDATNKSDLLLFSDKQKVYKMKLYELEDTKASSMGIYLPNILELEEGEQIIYAHVTTDYTGMVLCAYENGRVSKISLNNYETKTNRRRLVNAYSDEAPCIGICFTEEDSHILVIRSDDKAFVFDSSLIEMKATRNARGTQVMRITKTTTLQHMKIAGGINEREKRKYLSAKIPATGKLMDQQIDSDRIKE